MEKWFKVSMNYFLQDKKEQLDFLENRFLLIINFLRLKSLIFFDRITYLEILMLESRSLKFYWEISSNLYYFFFLCIYAEVVFGINIL